MKFPKIASHFPSFFCLIRFFRHILKVAFYNTDNFTVLWIKLRQISWHKLLKIYDIYSIIEIRLYVLKEGSITGMNHTKKSNLFFQYMRRNKVLAMLFFIITISIAFVAPFKSFIIQWIIDAASKRQALFYLTVGSIITVLSFLIELLSRNLATKIQCESISLIRAKLMKKMMFENMSIYFQKGNSYITSVLVNDMKILYDDYFNALYTIVLYGGMLFFAVCMYLYINPALLLFVALASIVPLTVPRLLDKGLQREINIQIR